jgi:hypothetical protein
MKGFTEGLSQEENTQLSYLAIGFDFTSTPEIESSTIQIDHTTEAVFHYYLGSGEPVDFGPETKKMISNSEDVQNARDRIRTGKTTSPAMGKISIDMEGESIRTYHVGLTALTYETVCSGDQCTTTYTVSGDGFWDIFWGKDQEDQEGELGGSPFKYNSFSWDETYENPGYEIDKNGAPKANSDLIEPKKGSDSKSSSSSRSSIDY